MMNREFWLKRLAVVAAIVLTAIGGVGLWNSVSDDSSTTAAAAVKEACNKIELSGSYDAAVVGRTRENGVVIEGPDLYVMEFNGDDLHSIAQVKTGTGPREWKVVDREYYFRNSKGWFLNVGLEFTPIIPNCSKLSNMEDQGEETSDDGAKSDRYTGMYAPVPMSSLEGNATLTVFFDYWISEDGGLVRHKRENVVEYTIDGEPIRWSQEFIFVLSGLGEENAITVPEEFTRLTHDY